MCLTFGHCIHYRVVLHWLQWILPRVCEMVFSVTDLRWTVLRIGHCAIPQLAVLFLLLIYRETLLDTVLRVYVNDLIHLDALRDFVAVFVKDLLRTHSSVITSHLNDTRHVEECKYKVYYIWCLPFTNLQIAYSWPIHKVCIFQCSLFAFRYDYY